jgi:hypothetical protein
MPASKKQFGLYAIAVILGIFLLSLAKNTAVNYATPFFLGYLGLVMALFNTQRKKPYDLLVGYLFIIGSSGFCNP